MNPHSPITSWFSINCTKPNETGFNNSHIEKPKLNKI